MIGLDTNVLVRFLVEDDPEQTERARSLLRRVVDADGRCYVSEVVVCEVVWVLQSTYRFPKTQVVDVLGKLLRTRHLAFPSPDRIRRALDAYTAGKGDLPDYLIREQARDAGFERVATFDKALHDTPGFEAL